MKRLNKHSFIKSALGMGTVEVGISIAILVALVLTFLSALTSYAKSVMDYVFDEGKVIGQI